MTPRSVDVTTATPAEHCDLCGGPARAKITNHAFFLLVTCDGCWADLKRQVDEFLTRTPATDGKV